jgi:hypothetical protein
MLKYCGKCYLFGGVMFTDICNELGLPSESVATLEEAYIWLTEDASVKDLFAVARETLLTPNEIVFNDVIARIGKISKIHPLTVNIVLCISCIEPLKAAFEAAGKSDKLDIQLGYLKQRFLSCKEECGVWGIHDPFWQWMFHELWCERLGRLEFEPFYHFSEKTYKGIKKGDPVILIHIPRGKSLEMDEVMESLAMGYERYKGRFENEIVPFMTHSWLLYPPFLREVFKKGGNLQKFSELFDIIDQNEAGYQNFPNVFGCKYPENGDFSTVPQNTSMQRSMLEFVKRGNIMGEGYGIFFYGKDGIIKG